jgi:hypothetical protein
MIKKNIFLTNFSAKKLAFLTRNKANLYKMVIITSVFEKNAIFSAENCQKSQKIVIITSTPAYVSILFKPLSTFVHVSRSSTHFVTHDIIDQWCHSNACCLKRAMFDINMNYLYNCDFRCRGCCNSRVTRLGKFSPNGRLFALGNYMII